MARIRLRFGNLNVGELITLAQHVRATMRDDSQFALLRSRLDSLAEGIDILMNVSENYKVALQVVQERLAERQAQRIKLENLLTEIAAGVDAAFGESQDMLQSAGFDVSISAPVVSPLRVPGKLPVRIEGAAALR